MATVNMDIDVTMFQACTTDKKNVRPLCRLARVGDVIAASLWRQRQAAQLSDPRAFNKGLHDKNSRILRPISIKLFSFSIVY